MKKINTVQGWFATLDQVMKAREDRYTDKEHRIEDIQKHEVLLNEETEDEIHQVLEFKAAALIPPAFRKVFSAENLNWVQDSRMNKKTRLHTWKMTSKSNPGLFRCEGRTQYKEEIRDGKPYTFREIKGEVELKIPMLGRIAEEAVYRGYLKNNDNDHKAILERLKKIKD